ncbi:MAG TPA: hydroxymethylbilane synthase [Alphaproteobacteria bacterium]
MTATRRVRIGTRGSPLALAQAEEVKRRLGTAWPDLGDPDAIILVPIKTTGDRIQDRTLATAGGKGLFTKEIEEALFAGTIDIAVHSMKDMPTRLPDGLVIPCLLPREDPRDVLIGGTARRIIDLPAGAVMGTSSLRRQAQLLALRPDLRIVNLRGNVETRLRKIAAGEADGTLLALAGLKRLGLQDRAVAVLEPAEMLPAAAQGAIGVECRADDDEMLRRLAPLHDQRTGAAVAAERALLERLDGSCRTPIAALAVVVPGGGLHLDALVASPDGSRVLRTTRDGRIDDAVALGHDAGEQLRRDAGPGFFGDA